MFADWTIEQIEFWTWVGRVGLVSLLCVCLPVFLALLMQDSNLVHRRRRHTPERS